MPLPGLHVLGQRFQRTRRANLLDGVGADAVVVTRHLLARWTDRAIQSLLLRLRK
jgi:hypothetical protein